MLCSTKTNIILLKICWMKNALRSSQPEKCRAERPTAPRCSAAGDELAPHFVRCPGLGAHRGRGGVRLRLLRTDWSLLALLTCPFCATVDFSVMSPVQPRSLLCLMHVQVPSHSHGERVLANNAGDGRNQSWPTAFWKIPWCVFFPCNLTLGRDPLIGAASREGLAGTLLGVVLVRWHCPRQGTEDAQEGVVRPAALPAQWAQPCRPCEWGGRGEP